MDRETLTQRLERLHGFIYSASGSGENEAHALIREAIAALAAETARADREAAARQEAEQQLALLDMPEPLCLLRDYRMVAAERDRLRAELAALRG